MSELLSGLMFCGLLLLFSLPALSVLRYCGKTLSRSLKVVLSAAILAGNLAGGLFFVNAIRSHYARGFYRINITMYGEVLAEAGDAEALELTRAWHYDPVGRPFKKVLFSGEKKPSQVRRFREPNFGGVWELRLPAGAKISEYDRDDGVYISIGTEPAIAFFAGKCKPGESLPAAIRAETERFLGNFKTPFELLARKDHCRYGDWRGTYLKLHVPARKTYLESCIFGTQDRLIHFGVCSQDKKNQFDIAYFVSNLRFLGYSK